MKTISKIITICLFMILCSVTSKAQQQPYPTLTLSSTDTLANDTTILYHQALIGDWYWSIQVSTKHISGAADSNDFYLMESNDGINYLRVIGSAAARFKTDTTSKFKTYIWSGGTGDLPLIWPSKYLGVLMVHTDSSYFVPKVILQKKITIDR